MSDPNVINYQPLEAMDNVWSQAIKSSLSGWGAAVAVLVIIVSIALLVKGAFGFILFVPAFYLVFLSYKVGKYKNAIWQTFAMANDWPFDTTTPPDMLIPPSMQFGHSVKFSLVIQAQLGAITCDLFTYTCKTGSGKQQQTHVFTVGRTALPKTLPHILLLSKKGVSALQRDIQNSEKLQLEGNFGDYFELQIEKGQEVDVLTILTPDVMQTLVTYEQAEDIEIIGNTMYFIANRDQRSYGDVQALVRSVVELDAQITQNISLATVPTASVTMSATPAS